MNIFRYPLIPTLTLFATFALHSQKIYITDNRWQADVKVYITDNTWQADEVVYITDNRWQADAKDCIWYFTDNRWQADKIIFYVGFTE